MKMARMSVKKFSDRFLGLKRLGFKSKDFWVSFRPASMACEIKLTHDICVHTAYSKRQNVTYVYIVDCGAFGAAIGVSKEAEGVLLLKKGKYAFSIEDCDLDEIFTILYEEHEKKMRKED